MACALRQAQGDKNGTRMTRIKRIITDFLAQIATEILLLFSLESKRLK
jgi:hypothetical protein